jgi:hypothetical protein
MILIGLSNVNYGFSKKLITFKFEVYDIVSFECARDYSCVRGASTCTPAKRLYRHGEYPGGMSQVQHRLRISI